MMPSGKRRIAFTRKLLGWYDKAARDLPWRRTRDPYRIAVSEFMLQQTQVSRVEEYYPRFLAQFPTIEKLAAARPKAVREAWEGLGYYRRAANLHALSRRVGKEHAGKLPDDPAVLITLPGVGPYTAGAIASFAFERPVPAVDTNVGRVIRRAFFGERGVGSGTLPAKQRSDSHRQEPLPAPRSQEIWALAGHLVPQSGKRAWKFNQAIMELGATVCTARKPRCPECPVRTDCKTGRTLSSTR
jgi:A/G-specific adenine glycosylase